MRAMIKVSDLTLRQWEWLQSNLKVEYGVSENDIRVCVQFELIPEIGSAHREMSVRDFTDLLADLKNVHRPVPSKNVRHRFDNGRMPGMTVERQIAFEGRSDFPGWDAL